jgi:hypothetical protein
MNGRVILTEMASQMFLGRLPGRVAVEASLIMGKIVSYDVAPAAKDILLVSDLNKDGIAFQGAQRELRNALPA